MSYESPRFPRDLQARYVRRLLRLAELKDPARMKAQRVKLPDLEELFWITVLKNKGYSNEEIASILGCNLHTLKRKLRLARGIWQDEEEES